MRSRKKMIIKMAVRKGVLCVVNIKKMETFWHGHCNSSSPDGGEDDSNLGDAHLWRGAL
jgi:hypothetical protein